MKEKTYETIIEMLTEELELQKWRNEQLEEKYKSLFKLNGAIIDAAKEESKK